MIKVAQNDHHVMYQNDLYVVMVVPGSGYSIIRRRDFRALTVYKTKEEFADSWKKQATDANDFRAWGAPIEEIFEYLKTAHFRALLRWRGHAW